MYRTFRSFLVTLAIIPCLALSLATDLRAAMLPLTEMELNGIIWEFMMPYGGLAVRLRFANGGVIEGYGGADMSRWAIEGDTVVLSSDWGARTATVGGFGRGSDGKWVATVVTGFGQQFPVREAERLANTLVNTAPSGVMPMSIMELSMTDWEFGRADGSHIARINLLADGRIGGYSHPNEARWAVQGNSLAFIGSNGKETTRFTSFERENGCWVMKGKFIPDGRIIHVLRQRCATATVMPPVAPQPVPYPQRSYTATPRYPAPPPPPVRSYTATPRRSYTAAPRMSYTAAPRVIIDPLPAQMRAYTAAPRRGYTAAPRQDVPPGMLDPLRNFFNF